MRVHWLAHVPFEGLGAIEDWVARRGHALSCTRLYAGEALPQPATFDLLAVMGGPMGANDAAHYPWLVDETVLIRRACEAGRGVLGICLGAQLIAASHGARVYRNAQPEIGWCEIERTAQALRHPLGQAVPERFTSFHWREDIFDLCTGATWLARSAGCAHQAFAPGWRTLGVQFHPEITALAIQGMLAALLPAPGQPVPTCKTSEPCARRRPRQRLRATCSLPGWMRPKPHVKTTKTRLRYL